LLALLERIIDTGAGVEPHGPGFPADDLLTPLERPTGMPIGNLTSQVFANLYLNDLDHWLKEHCRVPAYLRYVDDMVLLGDDKRRLAELRAAIRERLAAERLHLHPRKAELPRTRDGLDLLGYRVFPDFIRLRDDNGHRFARRLRVLSQACRCGRIEVGETRAPIASWIGHARHADSLGLRRAVLRRFRC
jgi:RNA-directed DNA polymerase